MALLRSPLMVILVALAPACAATPAAPATSVAVVAAPSARPAAPSAASSASAAPSPPMTPGSVSIGEIAGPPSWDPKPTLESLKPALLQCDSEARLLTPALHGKLALEVHVNASGAVTGAEAKPGGSANEPGLVGCVGDALKTAAFPKPGGLATVTVPLVFRQ